MNQIGFTMGSTAASAVAEKEEECMLIVRDGGVVRGTDDGERRVEWAFCVWQDGEAVGLGIHPRAEATVLGLAQVIAANCGLAEMLADAVKIGRLMAAAKASE